MHFRIRGNNVQVVKTELDDSGKKKSVPVGSFRKLDEELPADLASKLTNAELAEVKAWKAQAAEMDEAKMKLAAFTLPEQIDLAVAWFDKADPSESAFVVDAALVALRKLRKSLAEKS